jgi:hypothetical protein
MRITPSGPTSSPAHVPGSSLGAPTDEQAGLCPARADVLSDVVEDAGRGSVRERTGDLGSDLGRPGLVTDVEIEDEVRGAP